MKQVMDRVQIFRSVQAMQHHGTAGVRVSRSRLVQRSFEGSEKSLRRCLIRFRR